MNFPTYLQLPETVQEAQRAGWTPHGNGCAKDAAFKGKRYSAPGGANNLLFDPQGNVVGIQIVFPDTFNIAKGWVKAHVREGNTFVLTAYFTDPNNICSGNRVAPKGYIGDDLYLVMSNGPVKIPLKESDLMGTNWAKGKCYPGMGR